MRRSLDVLLAVVAAASVLPNLGGRAGLLPLVVAVVAPLVVRRRWPVAVFGWLLVGSALLGWWAPAAVPGVALLIGLFTVAASRSRAVALAAAAALEAGVAGAVLRLPGSWLLAAFLTGMLVAALSFGLYVAAHRAYVASLRARALSLERERDQQAELAAAAERARIARELHDIVAHHLTVMVALSDGAVATPSAADAAAAMRSVSATGRRALAETRRVVGVLRADPALQPAPGVAALAGLVDSVRAAGLPATLSVNCPAGLPDGVQLAAYRVVQEALTNTLKHAGPGARAAVRLDSVPGELRLTVDDTGAPVLRPPVDPAVGSGLIGMRERVRAYGGEVWSGPGAAGGWRVAARLGLEP
jgi:signal transduction histidine kinase